MKSILASFLIIISILILPLISTTTFAGKIADDEELQIALQMLGRTLARAYVISLNCSDKEAFALVTKQRMKAYERYAEAGFTSQSIDAFDEFIDKNIEIEKDLNGRLCDRESLDHMMEKTLKMDYDYFVDVINRYVPLNHN